MKKLYKAGIVQVVATKATVLSECSFNITHIE